MTLTSGDLARFEAASRLLLSPLAAPDARLWLYEAGRVVRELVRGHRVVLLVPGEPGRYQSEDAPEVATGVLGYIEHATEAGVAFSDPVVDAWYRLRAEGQHDLMTWDDSRRLVEDHGFRMTDSPIVSDVLLGQRYKDFNALTRATPEGDAMIWTLHAEHGGFAFGDHTAALLSLLLPSFCAGVDALSRMGSQRATLDAMEEPALVVGPDGGVVHRTPALVKCLAGDPEAARVEIALLSLARSLVGLGFPRLGGRGDGPCPVSRSVATALGRYDLQGALLPPGAFGEDGAAMIRVQPPRVSALPSIEEIRERFFLTRREAEVALLLAEGLSNAELADRLYISPHTARHHVESVLSKLEVPGRSAVAARLLAG